MTDKIKGGTNAGLRPATLLVRGGTTRSSFGETSESLFLTSGFTYPSAESHAARMAGQEEGYIYSRFANPTVRMFEERLALLEGAEDCRATASGMAAIHTLLTAPCNPGDRIIAARQLFASCVWILKNVSPKMGVEVEWIDATDLEAWKQACLKPVRLALVETPTNPMLDAVDLSAVADLVHAAGGELIVDNVFASPCLQKPLQHGADWVVYSATKHMDGQGRVLGGAILGRKKSIEDHVQQYYRHTGPSLSAFNAWVLLKGLETLDLRVRRMADTAAQIADLLARHPAVSEVRYPGRHDHPHHAVHHRQMETGGTLIAFSLKGGKEAAFSCLNGLKLIDISNNLGDAKTLITHPATTTHRTLTDQEKSDIGLTDAWIRLSIGLEDPDDLSEDLDQSLSA